MLSHSHKTKPNLIKTWTLRTLITKTKLVTIRNPKIIKSILMLIIIPNNIFKKVNYNIT